VTAPAYGYAHRGRVLRAGDAEGHYVVSIPALAPGCASGPFPSTVRDLQTGDAVLLTQIGLSMGDLVITGRLPERAPDITLPIDISDVSGLQTALDNRATDAELAAVNSTLTASILTEHNTNATQDGRLTSLEGRATSIEGVNTTQNTRLTTAESNITTNTANIATNTTNITTEHNTNVTQDGRLTALESWSREHQNQEFDSFGDIFTPFPRIWGSNVRTITNNLGYYWLTRSHIAATCTRVRVIVKTAGTVGNCTGLLLKASTLTGTYSQIGSATNNLQTTGVRDFTFTGVNIVAGDYLMAFLVGGGYTVAPQITALQNAVQVAASLSPVWGTKSGLAAPPSTISPLDGTWTTDSAPWWIAIA
jgi:hypothetical protein